MRWEELKTQIYHEDGSLRDIFIRNVNRNDWKHWADYVNSNNKVDFEIRNVVVSDKINFDAIVTFWEGQIQECPFASIYLNNVIVKIYFDESEIEMDIDPREIKTIKDHETFLGYLKNISTLLGKSIEVTEENAQDPKEVLIIINGEQVNFPHLINGR
jgi:hypothetical protein